MQNKQNSEREEWQLVREAQEGSAAAQTVLLQRYYSSSLRLARGILRNRHDAEDEVQNAYVKVLQHIRGFQGEASFSTWLNRIITNQCLMRLRRARRMKLTYMEDTAGENGRPMDLRDTRETPEDAFAREELDAVIKREIQRVPPLLRDILLLRDVNGMRTEDAAAELGITPMAAKSRLLRARRAARERLQRKPLPQTSAA